MKEKFWDDWAHAALASRWGGESWITVEDLYQAFKARMEAEQKCPDCGEPTTLSDHPNTRHKADCPQIVAFVARAKALWEATHQAALQPPDADGPGDIDDEEARRAYDAWDVPKQK